MGAAVSKNLAIIVPTRGRPQNIERLVQVDAPNVDWYFCVDDDDDLHAYTAAIAAGVESVNMVTGPPQRLVPWINQMSAMLIEDGYQYIGFIGDDHLPRTPEWDKRIIEALERLGTGIVYTNDLLQSEKLPTVAFMTSDIIRTLGYMAPPCLTHLFVDDAWLAWGRAIKRIAYLPQVVIEHLHPIAGKAEMDANYETTGALLKADGIAYAKYKAEQFFGDVTKLEKLLKQPEPVSV